MPFVIVSVKFGIVLSRKVSRYDSIISLDY